MSETLIEIMTGLSIHFKDGHTHQLVKRVWPDKSKREIHYVDAHDNRTWTVKLSEVDYITL